VALHKVMIWSFIEFGLITVLIIINLNIDTSQYIIHKLIYVKSIIFIIKLNAFTLLELDILILITYIILHNLTALNNRAFHVKLLIENI